MRRIWQWVVLFCVLMSSTLFVLSNVSSQEQTENTVEHVVHISIDGLNASLLRDLLAGDSASEYAAFQRLLTEGASTWNARTDYAYTLTIPNHISMLTGLPVLRPVGATTASYHGYTINEEVDDDTIHEANIHRDYTPSVFDVAHDNGLTTALYASKDKFSLFERSYGEKIDSFVIDYAILTQHNAERLHERFVVDFATEKFNYSFLHYRDPDSMGHLFDWGSAEYNQAIAQVDGYLSELLLLIENDPDLSGNTVLIVTTDHGGGVPIRTHTTHDDPANYTIPLFIWGANVAAGADLYALNSNGYQDPGSDRPPYALTNRPIRSGVTGNLALQLLGLPMIEGSYMNVPINVNGDAAQVVSQDLVAASDSALTPEPTATLPPLPPAPTAPPPPPLPPLLPTDEDATDSSESGYPVEQVTVLQSVETENNDADSSAIAGNEVCRSYASTDVPAVLDDKMVQSGLLVSDSGVVTKVTVSADISHSWIGDLTLSLIHGGSGTVVNLLDRPGVPSGRHGCFRNDLVAQFDETGVDSAELTCPKQQPTVAGLFAPSEPLNWLNGEEMNGVWVLQAYDGYVSADTGVINSWQLDICSVTP